MAWGYLLSIDCFHCNPKLIRSALYIQNYIKEIVELLGMKKWGEPTLVHFGSDPKVCGFTFTQMIETSLISGHFVEQNNSAFIDIFSCKEYEKDKAYHFTAGFFQSKLHTHNFLPRGVK